MYIYIAWINLGENSIIYRNFIQKYIECKEGHFAGFEKLINTVNLHTIFSIYVTDQFVELINICNNYHWSYLCLI